MLQKASPSTQATGVSTRAASVLSWAGLVSTRQPSLLDDPPATLGPDEIAALPVTQLRQGMGELLLGRYAQHGLEALLCTGILKVWLPEVHALVGFGDGEWRHKDVWKHTKQVVWQSVPRLAVRWGALLHDVGKVHTRSIDERGQVHFFGHSEVGAAMFRRRIGPRLQLPTELHQRVHFLILHHLRASQYDGTWTDSAVRRFYKEMGSGLKDLLDLSRADITTKRVEKRRRGLRQISELSRRIADLIKRDSIVPPLPKGLGTAIGERFGIPPSKRIGDLRRWLEQEVEAGRIEPHKGVGYYLAVLVEHGEVLCLE